MSDRHKLHILLPVTSTGTERQDMAIRMASAISEECAQAIGADVKAEFVHLDPMQSDAGLEQVLARACSQSETVFMLPAQMHLDLFAKRALADAAVWVRKENPSARVFYDDVDPCHPLLLAALADECHRAAVRMRIAGPGQLGLIMTASGDGDPEVRAETYKLMRMLWEEISAAHGETGFIRHANPMLAPVIKDFADRSLPFVVATQFLWPCEHFDYAKTMVADASARFKREIPITPPIGDHPNVKAWFKQRALNMWWDFRLKTQRPTIRLSGDLTINTQTKTA